MTLEWSEPPSSARRRGKWSKVFEDLKTKPGEWAKLSEGKPRNCYSLAGRLRKLGEGDYEITSRTTASGGGEDDDKAGVWGRYIGHLTALEAEIGGADHENMEPEAPPE